MSPYIRTCIHTYICTYIRAPRQADASSAFRFEDGSAVWDDLVGAEVADGEAGEAKPSLPECAVRLHGGTLKAFTASVRNVGGKRYAVFLGNHWKGKGASSIWRTNKLIASSNLEALFKSAQKHIGEFDTGDVWVLGMAAVDVSESKISVDQPDASLLDWLGQFSLAGKLSEQFAVLIGNIAPVTADRSMRFFQIDAAMNQATHVSMSFLTKRLANETFHCFDADQHGCSFSLRDIVEGAVYDS